MPELNSNPHPGTEHEGTVTPIGALSMHERARRNVARNMAMLDASQAESAAKLQAPVAPAAPEQAAPETTTVDWGNEVQREQLITRRRAPSEWRPQTHTLEAGIVQQLLADNPFRDQWTVTNTGTEPVDLAPYQAGLQTGNQYYTTVAAGATLTVETEGGLWAMSASGTTVQVVDTFYSPSLFAGAIAHLAEMARARLGKPQAVNADASPAERTPK